MLKGAKANVTNSNMDVVLPLDTNSDIHYVKSGVLKGSILGHLLINLYMNNICSVYKLLFTLLYADDTCVLLSGIDLNDLIAVANVELISLIKCLVKIQQIIS